VGEEGSRRADAAIVWKVPTLLIGKENLEAEKREGRNGRRGEREGSQA